MLRKPLAVAAIVMVAVVVAIMAWPHRRATAPGAARPPAAAVVVTPAPGSASDAPSLPPTPAPGDAPQDFAAQAANPGVVQPDLPTASEISPAQAADQLALDIQAQGRHRATDVEPAATTAAGKWLLDDVTAARIWRNPQILAQAAVDRSPQQVTVITIWRATESSGAQLHRSETLMRLNGQAWEPIL